MEKTDQMNTATYEALRKVGASEEQAVVLATAIPDIEPLRAEMDLKFSELRGEMGQKFGAIERRLNAQTWTIVATLIAVGGLLVASNIILSR